jgi:electron transfer flavoprotein alpha/beta subunit
MAAPEAAASQQHIVSVYAPGKTRTTRMIDGSPQEVAKELVRALREDARVI